MEDHRLHAPPQMKRPDPNEAHGAPVHSPSDPTAFATVGQAPDQQPAVLWARQLGLTQPLDLVLRALRSDRYLGTALNYLHQEIPRALMQRWAPEVDFFNDLLALADAFATSPAIQNHYRHLRMDTPLLPQMDEGGMAKHPFASVVARRISTKRPENDAWLETLRAWWVLQFLDAESRSIELGKRRTNIGQAIRLCIQETTGFGLWTPVMMELRGPADTYRGLHGHLVGQASKMYREVGRVASHKTLLRDLAHIDASDIPDREVLSRDHVTRNAARNFFEAPFAYAPIYQARHLNAHWLEDLDVGSEDAGAGPAPSHLEDIPEDFDYAEVDEKSSPSEQDLHAKGIKLLSIEEQQWLPYSWTKPNPYERDVLKKWWKDTWRDGSHPNHDLSILTYLAAQTSMSVRLVLQLGIAAESRFEWSWDAQQRVLHRLPPRRYHGAIPDAQALPHLKPLAERIVLHLHPTVTRFLIDRAQQHADASSLGQWFGSAKEAEGRLRAALSTVAPRITPAMFGGWLAQIVFEESLDPVLTQLLSSISRSGLPGSCAYAAYNQPSVALLTGLGAGTTLSVSDEMLGSKLNCAGSAFHISDEWVKQRLLQILHRSNALAKEPSKWLEHHNALVTYLVVVLLSTSGARPVTSPFQAPSDFDLVDGTLYVEDKVSSQMHAGRLIPIDRGVAKLIRVQYLAHLKSLARITRAFDEALSAEIELLAQETDSTQLPFFFYLRQADDQVRHVEVSETTLQTCGEFTLDMQVNVLRHRQSTWLKSKGVDHEVINGLLGHAEAGTATWGPYSARTWTDDSDTVRVRLKKSVKALGISKPDLLVALPQLGNATASKTPRLRLPDASYGRQARAARTQRANAMARSKALDEIEEYCKQHKAVGGLDAKSIRQLEQVMLRRANRLPHPRAPLRYEVFCDWLQSVRSETGFAPPVKRRYLPRLEEASPFSADSPRANTLFERVRTWHASQQNALTSPITDTRGALTAAIIGLIVESRVANMAIIRSLLMNQDFRLVRLDNRWYLEHANHLDKYPEAPCTRFAVSGSTTALLLQVLAAAARPRVTDRVIRVEHKPLARILGLDAKSLTYDKLVRRLCDIVQQLNWQKLPGLCAGYLDGSLISVALEHASWYRLHKKTALGGPIAYVSQQGTSNTDTRDDADDRFMAFEATAADAPDEEFAPIVHDSRFAQPPLPVRPDVMQQASALKQKQTGRKAASLEVANVQRSAPIETPAAVALQVKASALMKATHVAIKNALNQASNARRDLDADLRRIISEQAGASVTCRMFVDWIRSLLAKPQGSRQLAISSVSRYFVALSACFEQLAYDHDLTKCEEEEVTELYVNVMEARRRLKADMGSARSAAGSTPSQHHATTAEPADQYRTWRLALSLLRKFHRYALRYYSVEEADWSEIGSDEETLSISPRIIVEREYLHALTALTGAPVDATLAETQAGLLLILTYRFGLRAAEASNLTVSDWVEGPEESHLDGPRKSRLVLVRSNKFRALKTNNSRRQIPLLFELTDLECQVIDRHMDRLLNLQRHHSEDPLLPDICGKEHLAVNMQMRGHVASQLKKSCSDPSISLHTARHSFANFITTMLLDETAALQRGLFRKSPSSEWIDHVRRSVLCHPNTTRRSMWALARLMGHSHPRMALRSYVHLLPEITYARLALHRKDQQAVPTQAWPLRGVIDLDGIAPAASYLAPQAVRITGPAHLTPSSVKSLRALRLLAKGLAISQVARTCDLTFEHAQDLARLEAEAIEAYGTQKRNDAPKAGLRPLLRHIKPAQLERYIDLASANDFDSLRWDTTPLSENLQPSTMIGPSRQLVLFRPEQFMFVASMFRQWGVSPNQMKIIASRGIDPLVLEWAVQAGLQPVPAEPPQRRTFVSKKRKAATLLQPKQHYQLDSVETGSPRMRVLHRCVVVPVEDSLALVQTSHELIMLLVVHLFMQRASRTLSGETPSRRGGAT